MDQTLFEERKYRLNAIEANRTHSCYNLNDIAFNFNVSKSVYDVFEDIFVDVQASARKIVYVKASNRLTISAGSAGRDGSEEMLAWLYNNNNNTNTIKRYTPTNSKQERRSV